jgi:drug/metabolite transporter (DMT)-like permease
VLSNLVAIAFALASALVIAWGTVVRQRIAENAQRSVMRTAMRSPLWWIGTASAVVAYGLQLIALGFGTLLIVQPILVLSLMLTLPLAAWYQGRRMSSEELLWCGLLTVSVGVILVFGRPTGGITSPPLERWLPAFALGLAAMGLLSFIARRIRSQRALLLGVVCGILYGFVAVLSKAVVDIFKESGISELLVSWPLYVLICAAGAGTILQQYSFHAGPLKHSLPAMKIIEPLIAFTLGYAVLKEQFMVDSILGWTVMVLAVACMILATIVLSQKPMSTLPRITQTTAPRDSRGQKSRG